MGWLNRTGNRNKHSVYGFVPAEEFEKVRPCLKPYTASVEDPAPRYSERAVHKDNTFFYNQNMYELPAGTYQDKSSRVYVIHDHERDELEVYDGNKSNLIIRYPICKEKHRLIQFPEKKVAQSATMLAAESELRGYIGKFYSEQEVEGYISSMRMSMGRYYRKAVIGMSHKLEQCQAATGGDARYEKLVRLVVVGHIFNPNQAAELISLIPKEKAAPQALQLPSGLTKEDITPSVRPVSDYERFMPKDSDSEKQEDDKDKGTSTHI